MKNQNNRDLEIEHLIAIFDEEELEEDFDEYGDNKYTPSPKEIAQTKLFIIGEPSILPLIEALSSENLNIRKWAAATLGDLEDERAIEPLLKMIQNEQEDSFLRISILRILGSLKDFRTVEPLIDIFNNDKDVNIQAETANTLRKIGDPQAVESLIEAISRSEDMHVKKVGDLALAEIGDPQAFDTLAATLEDEDLSSQSSAIYGLGKLRDSRVYNLILPLITQHGLTDSVIMALGMLGDKRAYPLLIDCLENDAVYYTIIIGALCELDPENTYELLIKIFRSGSNFKAGTAASCLGEYHFPGAFELLLSKIRKGDDYMEPYAALALGQLGDKRAVEPLIEVLTNAPENIAIFAALALGILGDNRAFEPLIEALNSQNPDMRFRIVKALGWLKDPRGLPVLKHLALNDFERAENVEEESYIICDAAVNSIKEIRRSERNLPSL